MLSPFWFSSHTHFCMTQISLTQFSLILSCIMQRLCKMYKREDYTKKIRTILTIFSASAWNIHMFILTYYCLCISMGIKYIHPIFIFQPPKENKKQKSQSQALFLEGALHILFIRDSFSRCFNV